MENSKLKEAIKPFLGVPSDELGATPEENSLIAKALFQGVCFWDYNDFCEWLAFSEEELCFRR